MSVAISSILNMTELGIWSVTPKNGALMVSQDVAYRGENGLCGWD